MSFIQGEFAIIAGCGRYGAHLTRDLVRHNPGLQLVVIDRNPSAFNRLSSEFSGSQVVGDATEISVLEEAGIDKADILIAATDEDGVNILVGQIARKIYNVANVVSLVYEPSLQETYEQIDIQTVCPSDLTTIRLREMMRLKEEEG